MLLTRYALTLLVVCPEVSANIRFLKSFVQPNQRLARHFSRSERYGVPITIKERLHIYDYLDKRHYVSRPSQLPNSSRVISPGDRALSAQLLKSW
ncbi:hypothetical protein F4775DRAFT_530944 [Biscogniauxia sp. FL1348]|nr:hypothetical protein F4775DRAFT_530944 [Biscogniauxia sp. FL1348]